MRPASATPVSPRDDEETSDRNATPAGEEPRFSITRDDGWVEAARGGKGTALGELHHGRATPEADLDLHGFRVDAAVRLLRRFLQDRRREGRRIVRVIHGKGHHSEGGVGVLGDAVVSEMTQGLAARSVLALSTCSLSQGGSGAILVRLDVP